MVPADGATGDPVRVVGAADPGRTIRGHEVAG